jgi:TrmH family RNA methyltransferase
MNASHDELVRKVLGTVRSLGNRRGRDHSGCFWIEGVRNFLQAHDHRAAFRAVVVSEVLLRNSAAAKLVRRLATAGVPLARVSPEQFRSVSTATHASGVGAILQQRWTPIEEARADGLCWLVVEQIGSPGNLGTIVRTAEAVGAGGVIFVGPQGDPYHPTVVRASMGGLFALHYVRATHDGLRAWIDRNHVRLIGLSPEAESLWTEGPLDRPVALVVGEERCGLSPALRRLCESCVRLPMTGKADSLNVGVATGVMLYELVRRKISSSRSD